MVIPRYSIGSGVIHERHTAVTVPFLNILPVAKLSVVFRLAQN